MCESFAFMCCALLFFASSTNSLGNITVNNRQDNNSMIRLQFSDVNSTRKNDSKTDVSRYNLHNNYFTTDNENVKYAFGINSKSNNRKNNDLMQNKISAHYAKHYEDSNQIPVELKTNFTEIDNEDNSDNENENRNHKIVPYKICENITCIRLCCSLDDRLAGDNCIPKGTLFPNVRNYWDDSVQSKNKKINQVFQLSTFSSLSQDPCKNRTKIVKIPLYDKTIYFEYIFLENGTLYLPYFDEFVESSYYCLDVAKHNQFDAIICMETVTEAMEKVLDNSVKVELLLNGLNNLKLSCRIMSMLCMLTTFLVYSILPELKNIHGFMLRKFSSLTFTTYMLRIIESIVEIKASICVTIALVTYFCSLASFFWLIVMSFDMWWTFRNIHLIQKNVKQQEKKKYIYSAYAWGSSFILTIITIIMDYVPGVPKNFRPGFGVDTCWFSVGMAEQLYAYGPSSICIISSVCLTIYTALRIVRQEKDATFHLKSSESRCYNENKKWFNLYLKLFIILFIITAIAWIISATKFWLFRYFNSTLVYVMGSAFVLDVIHNIGILIIFVCKKTIIRSLLKRFCHFYEEIPTSVK